MARIKSKNTKPEMRVRRALHAAGLRYRLHEKRLPGRPDLVLSSMRIALFVNGCFFHQHPGCPHARMPKSRLDFWRPKLTSNTERDKLNRAVLESAGWTVMVTWECETRDAENLAALVEEIQSKRRALADSKKTSRSMT
jgi:DNA mismatch endonuclease (patch repair protein)